MKFKVDPLLEFWTGVLIVLTMMIAWITPPTPRWLLGATLGTAVWLFVLVVRRWKR